MKKLLLLDVRQVEKHFGAYAACRGISFELDKGGLLGLLGPNGAGKTTLLRMITGITQPDSGRVLVYGQPVNATVRRLIGYMPEERGIYKKMRVDEQLLYFARLRGMTRHDALQALKSWAERLHMTAWLHKKTEEISKGMTQKVQFVATVMHRPPLIVLDEPFSGLDPINANLLQDEIYRLNQEEGTGVLFSTHRMEQVEEICRDIVLVNSGQNILSGSVADIKRAFKENRYRVCFDGSWPEQVVADNLVVNGQTAEFTAQLPVEAARVLTQLLQNHVVVNRFEEVLPTLNDIFIRRVGEVNLSQTV